MSVEVQRDNRHMLIDKTGSNKALLLNISLSMKPAIIYTYFISKNKKVKNTYSAAKMRQGNMVDSREESKFVSLDPAGSRSRITVANFT